MVSRGSQRGHYPSAVKIGVPYFLFSAFLFLFLSFVLRREVHAAEEGVKGYFGGFSSAQLATMAFERTLQSE